MSYFNLIRTVLGGGAGALMALLAFLPAIFGCTKIGEQLDCTGSWLPPEWVATVSFLLIATNLIMKGFQGGSFGSGLVKKTVVVDTTKKVGTVAPAAVVKTEGVAPKTPPHR